MDTQLTLAPPRVAEPTAARRSLVPAARRIVGGFFLVTGGVHLGLVAADPEFYRGFADGALFGFVSEGWAQIVMARPEFYGLLLMAGEILLGAALLLGGRAAYAAWIGVLTFHLLLLVFGWWAWIWSVPVLALLVPLAVHDMGRRCRP